MDWNDLEATAGPADAAGARTCVACGVGALLLAVLGIVLLGGTDLLDEHPRKTVVFVCTFVCGGLPLLVVGLKGVAWARQEAAERARMKEMAHDLVPRVLELKREGKSPNRFLRQIGINSKQVRSELLLRVYEYEEKHGLPH
jgi:hypothetical protein